ncbi:MAG: hypothetical protein WBH44_03520 [Proteocatella sp.]
MLCNKLSIEIKDVSFEYFNRPEIHEKIKAMVFVIATDTGEDSPGQLIN